MKEKDVVRVVELIDESLQKPQDEKHLKSMKKKVNTLMKNSHCLVNG